MLGAARLREVEEQAYILVYSLEAATREAAAQVQGQGLFGASQEPMEALVVKLCICAMSLPGQILPEPSNGLNFASHRVSFGFC